MNKPNCRATVYGVTVMITVALLASCASNTDSDAPPPSSGSTVMLTPAQRQHVQLYTVPLSTYRKTLETTGVVDFDNDQATGVVAPLSGPVTRLLVALGAKVKKGDALAAVDSPDFAAAVGAYHKALATAQTNRRLADLDKDLAQHNGVSQREADQAETDATNAEADRDAALQAIVALGIPDATIKEIQDGTAVARVEALIRSPIAGTVVERLITPGQLLEAGTTPALPSRTYHACGCWPRPSERIWPRSRSVIPPKSSRASVRPPSRQGRQYLGTGRPRHPFSGRARGGGKPSDLLKKQMYVRVRITAQQASTGVLVPVSAVLRDNENLPFIYQVQPDGSYGRVHVALGRALRPIRDH